MQFSPLPLAGAWLIDGDCFKDDRGYFGLFFKQEAFDAQSLNTQWVQTNKAFNHQAGTLRGLHFQHPPYSEVKLITCITGAIFDVIVDIRPNSPTYHQWTAVTLTEDSQQAVYVPQGFAHGYQTLAPNTLVVYQVSCDYHPEASDGLRWDDPSLKIDWPNTPHRILSERDQQWALL